MKMTFTAKIVADISNDPMFGINPEPSYKHLQDLLVQGKCSFEMIMPWDNSGEPTLVVTEQS